MLKAISHSNQLSVTAFNHLRMWWVALVDAVTLYQKQRACYAVTYRELIQLTDRDLADIGIPRSAIPKLAKEEAIKVGAK